MPIQALFRYPRLTCSPARRPICHLIRFVLLH